MTDFKAKMHQIQFPLGLRPRPRSPSPLAVFKGPTSKGREGEEKEWKGMGGKGKDRVVRGREARVAPQLGSLDPPVMAGVNARKHAEMCTRDS